MAIFVTVVSSESAAKFFINIVQFLLIMSIIKIYNIESTSKNIYVPHSYIYVLFFSQKKKATA